jgi:hypothetical protein
MNITVLCTFFLYYEHLPTNIVVVCTFISYIKYYLSILYFSTEFGTDLKRQSRETSLPASRYL